MPSPLRLERFDAPAPPAPPPPSALPERDRLSAYDSGYAAGWEDAVGAAAQDRTRLSEDLAQSLRDLSFTYVEARSALLRGLEPLLRCMVERVLPALARGTLGAAVLEQVRTAAAVALDGPVTIVCAPADLAAIEAALPAAPVALSVRLLAEPSQAPGQVHFRLAESSERAIDLPALLAAIQSLVTDFLSQSAGSPAPDQDRPDG